MSRFRPMTETPATDSEPEPEVCNGCGELLGECMCFMHGSLTEEDKNQDPNDV